MARFDNYFSEKDMRDENEKRIFKTIRENDVETLKKILKNPVDCRLGQNDTPILSIAVLKGDCAMINHLIDSGCDPKEVDKNGLTALQTIFDWPPDFFGDVSCQLDLVNILLPAYSNPVEAVFLDANKYKMTPFLRACYLGYDAVILRFLDLLENKSIPMDHVIDCDGLSLFHHILDDRRHFFLPTRLETVRALIDKFSYYDRLIDAKNDDGDAPLYRLISSRHFPRFEKHYYRDVAGLANIFFQYGARPNIMDRNGCTYLDWAIDDRNVWLIEVLLRVGCRTDISRLNPRHRTSRRIASPLANILINRWGNRLESIRVIELFLAFGYDLQNELYLYTEDERPIEFASPDYARLRDTSKMDPEIVEALQELRRSKKMFSLKRQCRNTIRRHLGGKADEIIGKLDCVPDRIRSFLLAENEKPVLEMAE